MGASKPHLTNKHSMITLFQSQSFHLSANCLYKHHQLLTRSVFGIHKVDTIIRQDISPKCLNFRSFPPEKDFLWIKNVSWIRIFLNTLRPRQNGHHFADDIFKCIFLNENVWIPIKISLKFVPKIPINNIPALVQIMAWRWQGDKPLSEPVLVRLLTHIYASLGLNELR